MQKKALLFNSFLTILRIYLYLSPKSFILIKSANIYQINFNYDEILLYLNY